ncbi:MAG: enoyl-CoA hydratase/isomerase family protein [Halioglobus sp.]
MSTVTYELKSHIAIVTLNRPDKMNTFNPDMYREFNAAMARFRDEKEAWVAVIAAAGDRAFSAGVDIKALDQAFDSADGDVNTITNTFDIELQGEYFTDKPIIAAIQGYCVGEGLSTALACDLRIAAENASFMLPEGKIGVPTVNASIHGANLMGSAKALELLLLGESRDAAWALQSGLVNLVVPAHELLDTAMAWAEKIASISPVANRITKEVVVRSRSRSFDEVVAVAGAKRDAMANGHDAQEGRRAFIEKRKPNFIGE